MPKFPFLHNYKDARTYYGPSLSDPKEAPQLWMAGEQSPFHEESSPTSNLLWTGAAVAGVFGAGFIPARGGKRVWDHYVRGIRAVEEYSPAQIFRTFQLSTFFSQFETATKSISLSPRLLGQNVPYTEYLASVIGPIKRGKQILDPMHEIQARGLKLEGGRLLWGDTGKVALPWAGAVRVPEGAAAHWQSAYARTIGAGQYFDIKGKGFVPRADTFFSAAKPLPSQLAKMPMAGGMPAQIIGGRNLPEYLWRQASAWGTEEISRFNRLLRAPAEMEPFRTVFSRVEPWLKKVPGFKHGLAVAEGPGLKMLGKLSAKYGLGLGAAALAYQTVDWAARRAEVFDETLFAEGVTAGVATLGVRSNVFASKVAETLGLHRYRETQEEIAPGSTSLTKLAAFPLMGGLGAMLASYGVKTGKMAKLQWGGATAPEARKLAVEAMAEFGEEGLVGRVRTALTSPTRGLYARQDLVGKLMRKVTTKSGEGLKYAFLGKIGPTKLAAAAGIAIGAALVLPFLPGALIPGTRPEELEKIYSGEQEIPVRRGRWWEFGRSSFEGQRISHYKPHWYSRMLTRAREKSIWGDEEPSPLTKWWKKEFTYDIEKEHYRERPYPITGLPFEDVPFIGPLLAHTIGKIIKPELLMHTEEWLGPDGKMLAEPPRFGGRVATEIGETAGGVPESPYGIKGLIGEQVYRMTEMIGLPGFAMVSLKEKLTGSQDVFDQTKQLESARRIAGFERWYWDQELGGLLGMTEAFRRLYPHRRRQIPLYNPIRNLMPEWLPGPGEKAPDLWHGDPYCIASETLVEVLEGCYKRVDGLTTADKVRTHIGKWVHPSKIVKRDMNPGEKLYEIKVTSLSAFPIKASEGHPFWTADGWIETKDLEVGNYVGYPLPELNDLLVDDQDQLLDLSQYCDLPANSAHIFIQGSQEYANCVEFIEKNPNVYQWGERKRILEEHGWSAKTFENAQRGLRNNTLNRIPRKINPWCAEWGLLSGYYVAEGCVCNGSISFAFHKDEKIYQGQVLDALEYLFGLSGAIYSSSEGNGVEVIVTNKALAQILPRIFGVGSYNKKLPLWAGSFVPALSALFNGDGSFFFDQGKPRLSLKSKSKKLLWSVRQFLLLWGFVGNIVEDNLVYRGQAAKDCAKFISTLKYQDCSDSSRLCRHTYIKNGYVWMRIFSKQEVSQEPVYGIEVNVDDSFCVVGVATHNTKVPEGELRLPGRGYEARFPELEGIEAEDYPIVHKYKILADVAPYSDKFKAHRNMVQAARKFDTWSEHEEKIFQVTKEQVAAKKKRLTFQEYEYLTPMGEKRWGGEEQSDLVTTLNRVHAEQEEAEKGGVFSRAFGGYWEALAHNAETAWDQLTPISPGAKLVHIRSAVESYEKTQLYGTESAFWQHPWKHFIRPFAYSFAKGVGFKGIPDHVQDNRSIEEYFDTLEYVKFSRLSNIARSAGDKDAVKEFESKKNQTLFGINPFTRDYGSVLRALPRRERDYFNAFAEAETTEERARILDMVPENERGLYVARWKLQFADDVKGAQKAGLLSEEQIVEADEVVDKIYEEAKTEGFPTSEALFAEYVETRLPGESYGDWYRRTKLLPETAHIPGPDWVGWHPSVDLEDIKLKLVQNMGEDMHDYDLWSSQAETMVNKSYINQEAIEAITGSEELTENEMRDRINEVLLSNKMRPNVFTRTAYGGQNSLEVDIEQDPDIDRIIKEITS